MGFWRRTGEAASDPWLVLASAFISGAGWAANIVSAPPAIAIGGGLVAVGAVAGGLVNRPKRVPEEEPMPELVRGTPQAGLVAQLDTYVGDLEGLRRSHQQDALVDLTVEALVAAKNARRTGALVAAAVDGLDAALERSSTGPSSASPRVREVVTRMAERRDGLLRRLAGTVDEVALVYTKLLEMSAAVSSFDAGSGAPDDVARVSSTLDSLRGNLAELESRARDEP